MSLLDLLWVCLEIQTKMEECVDHQDEKNQERIQDVKHLLVCSQVTIPALGELNEPESHSSYELIKSEYNLLGN